ncbi:hypothetical protein C4579_00460 [Candidatus Microgenomates bacterium]|nr:MAG: hypothetical protein C4579_00460 [Candidatus Microgenomates bacterium]
MNDDAPAVIDAEIEENNQDATPQTPGQAQTFDINAYNATLEVVRRRLTVIENAKVELRKLKEMYNDSFLNDELFVKADKIVKEATQKRKDIQNELAKQPAIADIAGKLKDLKEQIKSEEVSLADELMEYYKTAGVMEIEDADGNVREFQISIRLKPKVRVE